MLEGKIALVTGSSRGIGKSIAIKLAKIGAVVIINYNKSEAEAIEVLNEVKKYNRSSFTYKADISNYQQVKSMVSEILKRLGKIDILVNNAVFSHKSLFLDTKYDYWKKTIDVNLTGYWICSKLVSEEMVKNRSGRIINISSIHDKVPKVGHSSYDVCKAGIKMLTKCMALELGKYDILTNTVSPGAIYTDLTIEKFSDKKYKKFLLSKIPLERIGQVEDISGVVAFLCSDDAKYINGTTIYVDGGYSLS